MSTEARKNIDVYTQFAGILAPLLGEQLRAAGGGACAFAPASAPVPAPGEPEEVVDSPEPLVLALRFEGALAGRGFLVVSAEHASLLAGGAAEPRPVLARAVQEVCEPFAAALFASYGSVRVHPLEDTTLAESDATPVAWLSAVLEDGSTVLVGLRADGELHRGLERLARVAAAAEASGIKSGNLGLVMDVELNVTLRFGQRQLLLREVMDLASGSVVELDREVDEPVELVLDGRVIARGEAVIVDGNYGVRVTEVLHPMVI